LDPVVDAEGNVLPGLLVPTEGRSQNDPYNGATIQYLQQYAPFPYGVSTFGIAYNYYKRTYMLGLMGERHVQMSETVIDSRPSLALKNWAEDEWAVARRAEIISFGEEVPTDRLKMEGITEQNAFNDHLAASAARAKAIYGYDLEYRLCKDGLEAYKDHISRYPGTVSTYNSHIDELRALFHQSQADRDYLKAGFASGAGQKALLKNAASEYMAAAYGFEINLLKYYVAPDILQAVLPHNIQRETLEQVDPMTLREILHNVHVYQDQYLKTHQDDYRDDRTEYETYLQRMEARLIRLHQAGMTN
jgi:hypothetical protein